jgi:hypothetical protein
MYMDNKHETAKRVHGLGRGVKNVRFRIGPTGRRLVSMDVYAEFSMIRREMTNVEVTAGVACPWCKAAVGKKCWDAGPGNRVVFRKANHKLRVEAARQWVIGREAAVR